MDARSALAVALVTMGGCVLVVSQDAPPAGSSCVFGLQDGPKTACHECIAQQCQASVDACCDPRAGCGLLDALDHCASSWVPGVALGPSGPPCAPLMSASGLSGADADLQQCVARQCGAMCFGPSSSASSSSSATSSASSSSAASSSGTPGPCSSLSADECLCEAGSMSGDGASCTQTSVQDAVCCADANYPTSGTFCSCERLRCQTIQSQSGTYCTCTLGGGPSEGIDATCGGGWAYCCLGFSGCTCTDDTPCDSGAQVAACDVNADVCSGSKSRVSTCYP